MVYYFQLMVLQPGSGRDFETLEGGVACHGIVNSLIVQAIGGITVMWASRKISLVDTREGKGGGISIASTVVLNCSVCMSQESNALLHYVLYLNSGLIGVV